MCSMMYDQFNFNKFSIYRNTNAYMFPTTFLALILIHGQIRIIKKQFHPASAAIR